MKKSLFCFIVCVFSLLYSCTNSCKSVSNIPEKGDIVLILDSVPVNSTFLCKNGWTMGTVPKGELGYCLNDIVLTYHVPNHSTIKDTIRIKSITGSLEIMHKYKGLDLLSFLAKPNDTLYFSYKGKMPVVRNSRETKKYDYAYEELIRKEVHHFDYSACIKYALPWYVREDYKYIKDLQGAERYEQTRKFDSLNHLRYYPKAILQLNREEKILDSLTINEYISKDISYFYKQRIKYKRLMLLEKQDLHFKDFKQNDELLKYSFYKKFIDRVYDNDIASKLELKESSNGYFIDAKKLNDSIQKNLFLNYGTRKYLTYNCLLNFLDNNSNKEINEYFKFFKSTYGKDTSLIKRIADEYKFGNEISKDLDLLTEVGKRTSFEEILANNKGKLIYVDFWASTCAPCRRCMPASHKLREEFKGKDVVFVYLAFNDKLRLWKKAVEQLDLKGYNDSYFIENSKSSKLIDDLNVGLIPRFLIYGKDGEILYKNAARPGTKKIRDVLNKAL